MAVPIPADGACSVGAVWTAIQLNILPNSATLKARYPTMNSFVSACATNRLEFEATNSTNVVNQILRNIASTGTSALQQNWRALHGSLFDSALGMAAAGATIYIMSLNPTTRQFTTTQCQMNAAHEQCGHLFVMRQSEPGLHFTLLLKNEQYEKIFGPIAPPEVHK